MIFGDLRRSENVEDRRKRRVAPEISQGVFSAGQPVPNVFDVSEGLLTGLGPDDFANEPIGPLSRAAGVEDVARRPASPAPAEPARWAMGALAAQDRYNPDEGYFQTGIRATPWFSEFKQKYGEEPNLNDPNYDYRAAWRAGARPDVRDAGDNLLHWPSQFKGENHPNRYVDGVDTRGGDDTSVYRGLPRLDPGLRRAPGDVAMRPAAETFGQVVGDLVIPQDPLDYAAMAALGPAGKLVSKGVRAGTLAMGGVLGLSDEAEAGKLDLIRKGIKAYHSSPHDFDKFDASKIGTGEGAQVYGHGLYFAENPAVSGQGGQYWNQFLRRFEGGPEADAAAFLSLEKFDRSAAAARVRDQVQKNREWQKTAYLADDERAAAVAQNMKLENTLKLLESGQPVGPRTYEVNIRADPAQMLDWDRPLHGQPMREALPEIAWKMRDNSPDAMDFYRLMERGNDAASKVAGGDFYKALTNPFDRSMRPVSQALQEAGIPGIKYLDQGSRGVQRPTVAQTNTAFGNVPMLETIPSPKQTHNYVVFDPSIVDIMKKYGIAGAAAPMGALAATDEYR